MWSLLTLLLVGLAAVDAQDQCYYAAGKKALDQYIPCGSDGVSACCLAGDFCLQDGACYSPGTKMTYIAGCTDPDYADDTCKGGSGTCNKNTQFQGLARCGSDWICCGGEGQSGDIPPTEYSNSCPCDQGYGTAIAGAVTLPGTESLGTSFATHPAAASSTQPSSPSSPAAASTTSSSAQKTGAGANSNSPSAARSTMATISIPTSGGGGITPVGSGAAAATTGAAPSSGSSGMPQSTKIGLGVGIPLGVAAIAAVSVALFCLRKRLLKREPQYVTQADLSTPVWVGEAPGSGAPAPRDAGAYSGNTGAGTGAGAGAASGWKANEQSSQMSEVGTPPPQYQNEASQGGGLNRPQSQGIWQPQRLQALQ